MPTTSTSDTILVFTARPLHRIIEEGGTQAWKVTPNRARQHTWVVCTRNRHPSDPAYAEGERQPHGSAFLVGRIADIVPPSDSTDALQGRHMIAISEYALIDVPDVWKGWRNPVRYTSLDELGIDPDALELQPVPPPSQVQEPASPAGPATRATSSPAAMPVIAEAKHRIAEALGVSVSAVEIIIRA